MKGEIIDTPDGPRIRRGAALVTPETYARMNARLIAGNKARARDPEYRAKVSERLAAYKARPDIKERDRARFKQMWQDPAWAEANRERSSARLRQTQAEIAADTRRAAARAAVTRKVLAARNADPEFQARRIAAARLAVKTKRDHSRCIAVHRLVDVQTSQGVVRMRGYEARRFKQFLFAVGETEALKLCRQRAKARRRKRSKSTVAPQRRADLAVQGTEIIAAVAARFGVTPDAVRSRAPRCAAAAIDARAAVAQILHADLGLSYVETAAAMERQPSTVFRLIERAKTSAGDPQWKARYLAAAAASAPSRLADAA